MTKMTALITGASSGIGRELARVFAANGHDLIITARRLERLEELKLELEANTGVKVTTIPMDISQATGPQALFDAVSLGGHQVDILVNNAGFGGHGFFHERSWKDDGGMIDLNIKALTELTKLFLPPMIERGQGKILNIASTAGMLPGPLQAVYYATKAYVNSLTEALSNELADKGVDVLGICPGPVDTEFAEKGNLDGIEAFESGTETPEDVAAKSYNQLMKKGKTGLYITAPKLKFVLKLTPFLPRKAVLKISRKSMEKG